MSGPGAHARARAQRRRLRRRLATGVVAVVALVAVDVALQVGLADARDERDLALAEQVAAEGHRAAVDANLAATDAAAGWARDQTRLTDDRVDRSDEVRRTTAAEAETDRASIVTTTGESALVRAHLDELRAIIATATGQIGDLQTCLFGVSAASGAAAEGDTAGATGALQTVAGACRRADAASGAVDPGVRFPYDFADPFVVAADGGYYAYATNSVGGSVQLLRSEDLVTWAFAGTALERVASWGRPGATWAPSVLARPGGWVLYYTVRDRASGRQCISRATAAGPTGPFVDSSAGPIVCELDQGGSIDPSPFVAPDGSATLLWKAEGETNGGSATLRAAPLSPDGLALAGPVSVLTGIDQRWEGRTIEGPSMVANGGGFLLLYSANRWDSADYAVGAAACTTPLGPCTKLPGPILSTSGAMVGPGGAEVFVDAAGTARVAFHAWQGDAVGYPEHRYLHIGRLVTSGGLRIEVQ